MASLRNLAISILRLAGHTSIARGPPAHRPRPSPLLPAPHEDRIATRQWPGGLGESLTGECDHLNSPQLHTDIAVAFCDNRTIERQLGVRVMDNLIVPAVVLVFMASVLLYIRRKAVRDSRRLGLPDTRRTATFLGGMLLGKNNAGPGTVRLEFFDSGIRLRGVGVFRALAAVWEARYEELTEARLVTAPTNPGVRLRAAGSTGPVIFWTRQGSEILDRLEEHAVPVDRTADQISDPPPSRIGYSSRSPY
jgi:hypothetical protein